MKIIKWQGKKRFINDLGQCVRETDNYEFTRYEWNENGYKFRTNDEGRGLQVFNGGLWMGVLGSSQFSLRGLTAEEAMAYLQKGSQNA